MKILITGATGFVGRHLVKRLSNHELVVIGRKNIFDDKVNFVEHDLLLSVGDNTREKIGDVDAVVHLAALMPNKMGSSEASIIDLNLKITSNLVSLFDGIKKPELFVFGSSVDVYPNSSSFIDEDNLVEPESDYARSKLLCENLLIEKIKEWQEAKLCILRIAHVYGKNDTNRKALDIFVDNTLSSEMIKIFGDGSDKRTYIYVEDLVNGIEKVLEQKVEGTFNLAGDRAYSLLELVEVVSRIISKEQNIIFLPIKKPKRDSLIKIDKAREGFGYNPSVNLVEGISRLVKHKQPTIFFDLDGPILDVKKRYYKIYREFVDNSGGKVLPLEEYWSLKKDKVKLKELLMRSNCFGKDEEYKLYLSSFRETSRNLKLDELQEGVVDLLYYLKKRYNLYLLTLRRKKEPLMEQLGELGLLGFFNDVLTGFKDEERFKIKVGLIKSKGLDSKKGIIIGDTETEINAAKELSFESIAISNGIRSGEFLEEAGMVCKDIKELSYYFTKTNES